jgi:NAD(P)-dependent dehydrogenase (short-subunit alcohol dehydrogenase family)
MGDRLAGRVAIVTGAGMGIGRGIARRYAREGCRVVVAELRADLGAGTAAEIRSELGGEARHLTVDVGRRDDVRRMVDDTVATEGRVDVLVNNAQGYTPLVPLEEKTDDMLARSLDSGLWATFWSMQAVFPHMRDQHFGRIINFCSLNGVTGAWFSVDYNATKEGIRGLTRSAAREWGQHNITVNAIAPGAASEGYRAWADRNPEQARAAVMTIPLQRMGDPEADLGGVALFLATDDGSYITGHTLFADGGGHMGTAWQPPRSTTPDGLGHFVADAPDRTRPKSE